MAALLDGGAQVDAVASGGQTALMLAASAGQTGSVALLLSRKADAHRTSNANKRAIDYAVEAGNIEAIEALRRYEAGER